jgi:hypothetical protein
MNLATGRIIHIFGREKHFKCPLPYLIGTFIDTNLSPRQGYSCCDSIVIEGILLLLIIILIMTSKIDEGGFGTIPISLLMCFAAS